MIWNSHTRTKMYKYLSGIIKMRLVICYRTTQISVISVSVKPMRTKLIQILQPFLFWLIKLYRERVSLCWIKNEVLTPRHSICSQRVVPLAQLLDHEDAWFKAHTHAHTVETVTRMIKDMSKTAGFKEKYSRFVNVSMLWKHQRL